MLPLLFSADALTHLEKFLKNPGDYVVLLAVEMQKKRIAIESVASQLSPAQHETLNSTLQGIRARQSQRSTPTPSVSATPSGSPVCPSSGSFSGATTPSISSSQLFHDFDLPGSSSSSNFPTFFIGDASEMFFGGRNRDLTESDPLILAQRQRNIQTAEIQRLTFSNAMLSLLLEESDKRQTLKQQESDEGVQIFIETIKESCVANRMLRGRLSEVVGKLDAVHQVLNGSSSSNERTPLVRELPTSVLEDPIPELVIPSSSSLDEPVRGCFTVFWEFFLGKKSHIKTDSHGYLKSAAFKPNLR